jgi:hypothetical protein
MTNSYELELRWLRIFVSGCWEASLKTNHYKLSTLCHRDYRLHPRRLRFGIPFGGLGAGLRVDVVSLSCL